MKDAANLTPKAENGRRIRVKFLLKSGPDRETANLRRRFPDAITSWGHCDFLFDSAADDYDWLVVYDDLPASGQQRSEQLTCPRRHTLLITAEPSSIKTYGSRFLRQFGYVLTSQEPWAIRHPRAVFSQPALLWFYGRTGELGSYNRMAALDGITKVSDISTVCSSKQQTHTLHRTRYDFVQALRKHLPELDVFGHGVRPIADKAEAIDPYRYHIAIENHIAPHHWTEKLADPLLGYSLPFYYGCPNAADYLPADSFIPITLEDPEATAEQIKRAIRDDEWVQRLSAIREARRRLLDELGIFPTLSHFIEARHDPAEEDADIDALILGRRALRISSPTAFLTEMAERFHARIKNRKSHRQA